MKILALILTSLTFVFPATAQEPAASTDAPSCEIVISSAIDAEWLKGIGFMYRLEFDKAEEVFEELLVSTPTSPAGDLALAGLSWWKYSQNYDAINRKKDKNAEKEFTDRAKKAIDKCETMTDDDDKNASAYFMMGTAYGLMGRWYAVQRSWWKAYKYGTRGRKYLKMALDRNPRIYDAYAGLGIFDYYSDSLPGIIKIPALLFVRGDKKRGLSELDTAISRGKFFVTESRLFLISILIQFEKKYDEAIKMAVEMRKEQPDNVFFRFAEIVARFNSGEWDGTISEGLAFLKESENYSQPAIAQQMGLIYLAIGDAYTMKDEYPLALEFFTKGITHTNYPEKGWVTFCYLRRAQIYDITNRREDALKDYKIVAEREPFWDTRDSAKRGQRKPFEPAEVKKQINLED